MRCIFFILIQKITIENLKFKFLTRKCEIRKKTYECKIIYYFFQYKCGSVRYKVKKSSTKREYRDDNVFP